MNMSAQNMVALILVLAVSLFGCGKKSYLEGKVVNGKGQPMSGVKVIARQIQPIKGYEQSESTTGSDGVFKFAKLFPTSAYELIIYPDGITKNLTIKTESGPEGQNKILPDPILIRISPSKDGITAIDAKTGLMWAKNANIAGKKMNWNEAMEWVKMLDLGGYRDWRLPTKSELKQFSMAAGSEKPFEYFNSIGFNNVEADMYWSCDEEGGYFADFWSMVERSGGMDGKKNKQYAWPVRYGQ